jgi:hypothetical protein
MNIRYIIKLQEISAEKSKIARQTYQDYMNNNVINLQREAKIASQKAREAYLEYFNYKNKYLKYKRKYLQLINKV